MSLSTCPACLADGLQPFYECRQVPVHTTLLMPTRQQALNYPRRDIELAICHRCGFITNRLFESGIHEYSATCEESQGCSPTFMNWLRGLATRLIDDYDISGKTVLEIGSGKGEFLAAICELGGNSGIGYDPAYVPGRLDTSALSIDFREEMWERRHGIDQADVIACRHTLEHIPNVHEFLGDLRASIGDRLDTLLFFEVPDTLRILKEGAFWDIYYEHCSYFDRDSLCSLFNNCGFEVLECWLDYDAQYIMLVARPVATSTGSSAKPGGMQMVKLIDSFKAAYAAMQAEWTSRLAAYARDKKTVMLWGGGSKAAAFLNQLDGAAIIRKVIDINPHKHHCFIPGSGQEVVGPDLLNKETADVIILMNSIYHAEVRRELDKNGHNAELLSV